MKERRASLSVVMSRVAGSTLGNMDLMKIRRTRKWERKLISVFGFWLFNFFFFGKEE